MKKQVILYFRIFESEIKRGKKNIDDTMLGKVFLEVKIASDVKM